MMTEPTVLALSLAYLGLLFAVAWFGDRYARDWSASSVAPAVYGLSLAIYCTSWTFYGAVGRAAASPRGDVLLQTADRHGPDHPQKKTTGSAARQCQAA